MDNRVDEGRITGVRPMVRSCRVVQERLEGSPLRIGVSVYVHKALYGDYHADNASVTECQASV